MLRSVKTLPSAWEIRDCVITSLPLRQRATRWASSRKFLLLPVSEECGSFTPCESHITTRASACVAVQRNSPAAGATVHSHAVHSMVSRCGVLSLVLLHTCGRAGLVL